MPAPTLYVLCGLPFAGKTVLAGKLSAALGCPVINVDEIRLAHGFSWTEDSRITKADWQRIFEESYDRTRSQLLGGQSVVYDCAHLSRTSRDHVRSIAHDVGCPSRLIFVEASVETVRSRWRRNRQTHERFDLSEALFESALAAFEPPHPDEVAAVCHVDEDSEKWIRAHLRDEFTVAARNANEREVQAHAAGEGIGALLAITQGFVNARFPAADVAIAGGSRVRGNAMSTSDVDLFILMPSAGAEHRESHLYRGLPIEAFVHNEESYKRYFASDRETGCPSLPQICAEGTVLTDRSGRAAALKREAVALLAEGPDPLTATESEVWRYRITDLLDDLVDATGAEGLFIASALVSAVAEFQLRVVRHWWGRGKWMLRQLRDWDADAADELVAAWSRFSQVGSSDRLIAYCDRVLLPVGGRLFDGFGQGPRIGG